MTGYDDAVILGSVRHEDFEPRRSRMPAVITPDVLKEIRRSRSEIIRSTLLPIGMSFLVASFAMFPVVDRTSGSKNLQLMTGISGPLYWLSNYLFDLIVYASLWVAVGGMFAYFYRVSILTVGE